MKRMGRIFLAVALAASGTALAAATPCAHETTAAGMKARMDTMRDQMDRIEVTTDRAEQRRLMELNMKHVREGLRELRKHDDIAVACRVEIMSVMLETMARHDLATEELQAR